MKRQILFVAYYYAILLCAYVFVFQVLTGVLMLYSLAYHLLIFLLFMLVHMSVFLMQCSCQPKFHVRDNKVLTYLLTYLLLETKIGTSEKITINGYVTEQIGRKISTNGRYYGGICIAIKNSIAAGVSVLKNNGETEFLWARLDKDFFNINRDLYVCFFYASPEKGTKNFGIEVYDRIIDDVAEYCSQG